MKLKFIIILLLCKYLFAINFYANPEDISKYDDYGLYLDNPTISKIHLTNTNWKIRTEGSDNWQDMNVPSCYSDPQKRISKVYYKTSFFLSGENLAKKHFRLVFYGINYNSLIRVNGHLVENQNSGYNSFEIDLSSDILNFNGKNKLEIEVDKKLTTYSTLPVQMQANGWQNYGGVFRDVFLLISSKSFINDIFIDYDLNDDLSKAQIKLKTDIQDVFDFTNTNIDSLKLIKNYILEYTILDPDGKTVLKSANNELTINNSQIKSINCKFSLDNPRLWQLEKPELYKCKVSLFNADSTRTVPVNILMKYFGFKDIKINGNKILLNNKSLRIKAVTRWEDIKGMGSAITYSKMKDDIQKIKKLGANLIYCKFNTPHPFFLDLCDRYGILICQELPILSLPNPILKQDVIKNLAFQTIEKSTKRDYHHPSLFALGLGEGYNTRNLGSIQSIIDLNKFSKLKAPNLLTFITISQTEFQEYYRISDIVFLNYSKNISNENLPKSTPVVISGIGSQTKNLSEESLLSLETIQAQQIQTQIKESQKIPNNGISISAFRDHRTSKPVLDKGPGNDNYLKSNGLISYDDKFRISYRAVQKYFKDGSFLTLAPQNMDSKKTNIFFISGSVLILILLYLIKREHYLRVNIYRFLKNPDALIVDIRDKRISQVWHPLFLAVLSSIGLALLISTIFWFFKEDYKFDFMISIFFKNNIYKEVLIEMVWNPVKLIPILTIFFLMIFILQGIYLKLLSYPAGVTKLPVLTSIHFSLWNSSLLLPTLLIGTFLLRFLEIMNFLPILGILLLIITVWFLFRYLLLMQTIYKLPIRKIIWLNIFTLGFTFFILYLFVDWSKNNIWAYLKYSFDMIL